MRANGQNELVVNNTLFIDKATNAVGINTMTPTFNLDVVGKIKCSDVLSVGSNITASGNITATGNLGTSGNVAASGSITATGNVISSSGNVGIGVTNPVNRLTIASNVPYANITTQSLRNSAQLLISQSNTSGRLYIANGYTGGAGTGSVIQSSDFYSGADNGSLLFLNPLGGSVSFGSNTWHTSSEGRNRIHFANNSTTFYGTGDKHVFRSPTDTDLLTINSTGNLGIGIQNPTERLHVSGNILATLNITAYSDARVKTNIVEIDSPLEKIKNMRGVYYNRTDDSNATPARHVGLIAQEVETVLPEVVLTDTSEGKHKSVAYGNIVALLIEGMKAQQSTIEGMLECFKL